MDNRDFKSAMPNSRLICSLRKLVEHLTGRVNVTIFRDYMPKTGQEWAGSWEAVKD